MTQEAKTLLGFDFGMKRIGVAIGQVVTKNARALTMVPAKEGEPDWRQLDKLIKEWQPDAMVVGIPVNMDGTKQVITERALEFAEILKDRYKLPIFEMDERLTSVEARSNVFNEGGYKALKSAQIDSVAAQLILQNWLDQYITK